MHAKDDAPEAEIIRMLKGKGYVSGQKLSEALGVTRTAVWKHIEALRSAGLHIEASPRRGYCLTGGDGPYNGPGISAAVAEGLFGASVYFHDKVESTNSMAFELGRTGEPEGAVVVADSQTGGKGRVGRYWKSPPGVNIYTSVLLRPRILPRDAQLLTFLCAVAVAETIEGALDRPPVVKWPNDVLVDGKKVSGILLEMDAESDRVNFVVAGIGINVNSTPSLWGGELKDRATSLFELTGEEVSRVKLLCSLYSNLERWYNEAMGSGFARVLDAWKGYFASVGRPVTVASFGSTTEGECLGIDTDGALLVKVSGGVVERVLSGDVRTK